MANTKWITKVKHPIAKRQFCNTDAQAVIDYFNEQRRTLTPLSYETVTLNRVAH